MLKSNSNGNTGCKNNDVIKIISVNVRGIRNSTKRLRIFNWLKDKKADIVYLQETYSSNTDITQWRNEWDGDIHISSGTNNSRGTAILFNKNLNVDIEESKCDCDGRYVFIKGTFNDKHLSLLNYYGPTKDKPQRQLEALEGIKPIIIDNMHQLIWGGGHEHLPRSNVRQKRRTT
jgi:exonuclease III